MGDVLMMNDVPNLKNWLSKLEVLPPVDAGALRVFGLRQALASSLDYLTLDEALDRKVIEVGETSEAGRVPELRVSNQSDSMVFLMAGEELVGAKQNRILNVSIMVAAGTELRVPVSCVEAGRWRYTSRVFSSSVAGAHSRLRAKMAMKAKMFYREVGRPVSDQVEVWNEIATKLDGMGSRSPSSALHQVYEDHRKRLREIISAARVPEGSCGAVFAFGGRIIGVDVFDKPSTFSKLWPKLMRSYAIDALEEREPSVAITRQQVLAWLGKAIDAKLEHYDSPGVGDDMRFDSADLSGGSLVVDDQPVHTELFAAFDRSEDLGRRI